jgi:hypothetical protein
MIGKISQLLAHRVISRRCINLVAIGGTADIGDEI